MVDLDAGRQARWKSRQQWHRQAIGVLRAVHRGQRGIADSITNAGGLLVAIAIPGPLTSEVPALVKVQRRARSHARRPGSRDYGPKAPPPPAW